MREHIKILGILNIVMGCFTASIGVVALIILSGVAGVINWSGASAESPLPIAAPVITLIGIGAGVFFLLLGLPSIVGGWGLLKLRPWARFVCIVLSAFHLLNFPLGTALGVYGFWALLSNEAQRLFSNGTVPTPPVTYPGSTA